MITTRVVERVYPPVNAVDSNFQPFERKSIVKQVEVLEGTKSELLEHIRKDILPYNARIRVEKSARGEFPFKMELSETMTLDAQFTSLKKAEDGLSAIFFMEYQDISNIALKSLFLCVKD